MSGVDRSELPAQAGPAAGAAADPASAFDPANAEDAGDPRVRTLIARYAALVGGDVVEIEPHLLRITLPPGEARFFGGRRSIDVAFSVPAYERHPDAEMAVAGSALLRQVTDAIRARGHHHHYGLLPPSGVPAAGGVELGVPLLRASASEARLSEGVRPLGRLTARVTIFAGAAVVERLVDTDVFDLAAGTLVAAEIEEVCRAIAAGEAAPAQPRGGGESGLPALAPDALLAVMLPDIEAKVAPELEKLRADAERALAAELARIDRYYTALLEGAAAEGAKEKARAAIEADYRRRRAEEERRHRIHAAVHPLQLARFDVLAQEATWTLTSEAGHRAEFGARRLLAGGAAWTLSCPTCAAAPTALIVCRGGHAACDACARTCSLCGEDFCREHGILACHVDGAPACATHARVCATCDRPYCSAHEGRCDAGGHAACASCLHACAICARVVCERHLERSAADAPRGARVLCADCVVHCEGNRHEPVGRDEAAACASCGRFVCERHQTRCEVDGHVHCSTHLRPSDYSRRLVCERHRAVCDHEPAGIFAPDEVHGCATCGRNACLGHTAVCAGDGRRHCRHHLEPLADMPGQFGCERHRTTCHLDGSAFSLQGTQVCPICERRACAAHSFRCKWCRRTVCTAVPPRGGRCATCQGLAPVLDPPDDVIAAATHAKDDRTTVKAWRTARDATHVVVELDLGWTRKVVFVLVHGDTRPVAVVRHSLLGSRERTPRG